MTANTSTAVMENDLTALLDMLSEGDMPSRARDAQIDAALRIGKKGLPDWAWRNFPTWSVLESGHVEAGLTWEPLAFTSSIDAAVYAIETRLPGWWWSTGDCSVSSHASIGPDLAGPDKGLLQQKLFDEGFHADLAQPSKPALALCHVLIQALMARGRAVSDTEIGK